MADSKVLFRVADEDGSVYVETLWATALGEDRYRLDNLPFYAYGVSWEDIVLAPFDTTEDMATFKDVVTKSGNRTVRLKLDPPVSPGNASDDVLRNLVALGCDYEGSDRIRIAVNIPADVLLESIREYLIARDLVWEHADPTYDTLFPDDQR
ncbi:hypothetical protein J2X02_001226 [Pseudoxanthomonas japonensis]|uniref:DUF4265 domain-containing protein n=1 Tax=Archangium gephyra TaxID=48 RepID=A0A2W5SKV9_9BACT|nr:DUF4265 domain-containing protein [Pseudoxanthomonas japonensis]MDR7068409.1 hypothetical protein [Pseudoxanthomonas japonensis]PZR03130.1 MAG: hypothetical protein DI536_36335 [Archangium gephyra]